MSEDADKIANRLDKINNTIDTLCWIIFFSAMMVSCAIGVK